DGMGMFAPVRKKATKVSAGGPGSGRHKGGGSYAGTRYNVGDKVIGQTGVPGVVSHVYDKNGPEENEKGRLVQVDHPGYGPGGGLQMNHREGDLRQHSGAIGVAYRQQNPTSGVKGRL